MSRFKQSVIPALLLALALPCFGQTVPATPSAPEDAARAALADFYQKMYTADDKALELLAFNDPQNSKAGRVWVQLALAQQNVRLAAARVWGAGGNNDLAIGVSDKDRQQFEKDLKVARVNIKENSAQIQTDHDGVFVVTQQKDGPWKVDFDRTQAAKGPLPKDSELTSLISQTAALNGIAKQLDEDAKTTDPAKRQFKSIQDLKSRLQQLSSTPASMPK